MSGNFYLVLGYSLMLTLGAVFIYFGYRFLRARIGKKGTSNPYVTLHNLEKGKAAGEIIFYFSVPEKMQVKLDILNAKDEIISVLEDKEFEAGEIKIKFDSLRFADDDYFYRITTKFQQTVKKFKIVNG